MSYSNSASAFGIGFILSAFIGLTIGILYAPRPGKETREQLKDKTKDIIEKAKETTDEITKKAKEMMSVMCDRLLPTRMEGLTMDNMMPSMMKEMMPSCLWELLPKMPNEMRVEFISNMTGILADRGSADMSEEEKENLVAKIIEKVKT